MRTLAERRTAARFINTEPTMTDQSAAAQTDLNIIMTQFLKSGTSPSTSQPVYGDFSELPTNLRDAIEQARSVSRIRSQLPPQLRDMPVEEILALTPEQIAAILTPANTQTQTTDDADKLQNQGGTS